VPDRAASEYRRRPCQAPRDVANVVTFASTQRVAHEQLALCGLKLSILWRPTCSMCLLDTRFTADPTRQK
jgi:hypothetical protein